MLRGNSLDVKRQFQRSRLSFDLSAKVTLFGGPSIYENTVFSETTWPIELKFHMETPYVGCSKFEPNVNGHITNMEAMPIYGKNPLNIFFSGTKRPMALTWYWGCGPYQVCTNDESGLTLIFFYGEAKFDS